MVMMAMVSSLNIVKRFKRFDPCGLDRRVYRREQGRELDDHD